MKHTICSQIENKYILFIYGFIQVKLYMDHLNFCLK